MSIKDRIMSESTFKDRGLTVGVRIYRTLTAIENARGKRTARAVAMLLELLHKKRFLSDQQLDEFLYDCVMETSSS
jgi:hypothetical protein